ncbi:hypothetical protein GCM10007216_19830 [Thalassobacillus devorans]|uniref:SF4 helicase domain-containing protein n=1 Tax=Thalassobacillus devorans TaxID=279813 RepID=A0ABQ1P8W0_9BACI|nr:DnaB-like helicase C-terminal domain-containing protein [Thalassobacillus devorans]NIK28073.1 replicative DNA helicase [Thalassobacillus devorans]GGC89083.1 hypothetical protein GCM10007216_19830 [Thalassobacillus devorans]
MNINEEEKFLQALANNLDMLDEEILDIESPEDFLSERGRKHYYTMKSLRENTKINRYDKSFQKEQFSGEDNCITQKGTKDFVRFHLHKLLEVQNQINEKKILGRLEKLLNDFGVAKSNQEKIELLERLDVVRVKLEVQENKSKTLGEIIQEDFIYDPGTGRVPSYINELDTSLSGGFSRGGIHILSAEPGGGKTTAAAQFSTMQALNGYKVLIISLEQGRSDIAENILSIISSEKEKDRQYWEIAAFHNENEAIKKRQEANQRINTFIQDRLVIDDTSYEELGKLMKRITRGVVTEKYDCIYIDNFQNAPARFPNMNHRECYEHFANFLMVTAKKYKVCIFALSQLTKYNGQTNTKYATKLNDNALTHLEIFRTGGESKDFINPNRIGFCFKKNRKGEKRRDPVLLPFLARKSVIGSICLEKYGAKKAEK